MIKLPVAALVLLFTASAAGADKALILNDQDQKDLVQVLDAATRAQGLSIAATSLRLYQKLLAAPSITEQKDAPHDAK